jgi:1,4-dihydroxy-2-naphthoate polyprenyltransferase
MTSITNINNQEKNDDFAGNVLIIFMIFPPSKFRIHFCSLALMPTMVFESEHLLPPLQRPIFMLISRVHEMEAFRDRLFYEFRCIMQSSNIDNIKGWVVLSRPPFHTVGILPFILGTFLAYKINSAFSAEIFILGVVAVILIMLSTYHSGEYFDYQGDVISNRMHTNQFAGGTRMLPESKISPMVPFWTSIITLILAGIIGIILQFVLKTGPYTLLLGFIGAFSGFFYSTKPIRLVQRGVGEIFIGFCYGWLPVASAFYIQTGSIHPIIHWMSIPIGLTIFNVILLNEFPDYEADKATGKKNLLYRTGKQKGMLVYVVFNVIASLCVLTSPMVGVPFKVVYFYLPFLIISLYLVVMMLRGRHEDKKKLEILCGLNIAVNLGTSLSYILAYI